VLCLQLADVDEPGDAKLVYDNAELVAGRNLAMNLDGRPADLTCLIRDRGSNFTASFDAVSAACGIPILRTAVQAPA
jgi:hypothetical protein